jgi:hypothetical protein
MSVATFLNQTLVQISVRGSRIFLYPQRADDVAIYHVTDPAKASPARPHEVRWVVDGLHGKQRLSILPAARQSVRMKGVGRGLVFKGSGVHTRSSGRPSRGPGHGHEMSWKYDVVLHDGRTLVARIDPTVIIKDDP